MKYRNYGIKIDEKDSLLIWQQYIEYSAQVEQSGCSTWAEYSFSRLATHYGFIDKGHLVKEISAAELEAACRKCIQVEVTNTKALVRVLDAEGLEYEVISDNIANTYGKVNLSQLVLALAKEDWQTV